MKRLIPTLIALAIGMTLPIITHASICFIPNGCTGTSTTPAYGQLLIGGQSGEYELVASSTIGGVTSVFGRSGAVAAQSGDYTTSLITEGTNLYYTLTRWASALAGTTTDALAEGINNLYFTNSRARGAISGTYPINYNSSTGAISTVATSSLGLTISNFASPNISQWTNNAAYLTSLAGAWPFTPSTYANVSNQSTTTPLWLNGTQLIASSTLAVNATTTNLTVGESFNTNLWVPVDFATKGCAGDSTKTAFAACVNALASGFTGIGDGVTIWVPDITVTQAQFTTPVTITNSSQLVSLKCVQGAVIKYGGASGTTAFTWDSYNSVGHLTSEIAGCHV